MATRNAHRQFTRTCLTAAIVCSVLVAACAAFGTVAFARPTMAPATETLRYSQRGDFTYNAATADGPVYDGGKLTTGDPVFLRLVPALNVAFTYKFDATAPRVITGTIGLRADVSSGNGWHRRLELQRATPFVGDHTELRAVIDTRRLQALITQVEAVTGVQDATHTITLLPKVQISGSVAGHKVDDVFAPRLDFTLDRYVLRLAQTPSPKTTKAALDPATTGTLRQRIADTPAELHLFGRSVAVIDARRVAVGLGTLFAFAAAAALVALRRRWHGQASRIELRHGHRLIPVAADQPHAHNGTVDLTTMGDLVRLADQHASAILHRQTETADVYLFQADRTTYRYILTSPSAQSPSPEPAPAPAVAMTHRRRRRGRRLQGYDGSTGRREVAEEGAILLGRRADAPVKRRSN